MLRLGVLVVFVVLEVGDLVGARSLLLRSFSSEIDARCQLGGVLTRYDIGVAEVEFALAHLGSGLGEGMTELRGVIGTVGGIL